jgi:hypothetical protein
VSNEEDKGFCNIGGGIGNVPYQGNLSVLEVMAIMAKSADHIKQYC